ncbi:MAG: inositol phosphorylceramide synthase [Acidimicrobiales bacterium]|nr:MAG: inositol phosphorylceramide synthase [Acidimicrobiales bacterium]
MWLPWDYALGLAVLLAATAYGLRHRSAVVAAFAGEAAIVSVLYSLWQYTGALSVLGISGALERGAWLWDLERTLRLPNELSLQEALVPHSFWTQVANIYYAGAHVPAMGIFLVWLFARHRRDYRRWRNTLALVTGACLLIQLIPLAPPRLTSETGMIDTGLAYGQSVYGELGRGIAGQLQAMPSIHVAWAALIGWAVMEVSNGRWRWLGPTHFAITFVVVAVTGNHYWLDGIVAMLLLVPSRILGELIANGVDQLRATTVPTADRAEPADHVTI